MSILGTMSGALNKKQPQAPTVSQTPEKDNSGTMAGNVANILNSNSLLMRSAAAKGERVAANRGLQNSTVGAEAAQRAMIDAAIPIAAQDTQHQFAASQAGLDREHQKGLAKLQADLNYSNQSRLNQEQNKFAASQADLDRGHQRGLAQLQADLSYKNQSRLVAANTIGKSIDFTMQIANNFDAQIAGILNNTAMKAADKEKAIKTLKSSRDSEINFVSKFMQGIPTTKQNWSSFPSLGVPSVSIK